MGALVAVTQRGLFARAAVLDDDLGDEGLVALVAGVRRVVATATAVVTTTAAAASAATAAATAVVTTTAAVATVGVVVAGRVGRGRAGGRILALAVGLVYVGVEPIDRRELLGELGMRRHKARRVALGQIQRRRVVAEVLDGRLQRERFGVSAVDRITDRGRGNERVAVVHRRRDGLGGAGNKGRRGGPPGELRNASSHAGVTYARGPDRYAVSPSGSVE